MKYAITISNVRKEYKLYKTNFDRLKDACLIKKTKKYYDDFIALDNISFNVRKGEIVGIIGSNGSGKSTLLKIITNVLNPTQGEVVVNGRVSAMLELGAGFNMEYNGIENIRLNGMLMGLSSEAIDERISSILEFAEIGDFAYQPVKTYSSGMFARLAFATSINVEPDILIIDEALSVGDMYFQEKCYEKMKEMVQSGATILFVSHSLPAVRNFCNRAIWIERGVMRMEGSAKRVCEEYRNFLENKTKSFSTNKTIKILPQEGKEKNKILITGVRLNQGSFYMNEDILISIKLEYRIEQVNFGVGIIIQNDKNELVTLFNTIRDDYVIKDKIPQISLSIPSNDFVAGHYRIQVNLCDDMIMYPYDKVDDAAEFEILSITNKRGIPISEGHFRAKHRWQIP